MVRSPDGDEWLEDVTGRDGATGPCRTRALRAGAGRGLAALYRFREELEGRELKTAIVRGLKAVIAQKPLEETPRVRQFNDGDETVSLEAAFGTSINPAMQAAVVRSRGRDAAAGARRCRSTLSTGWRPSGTAQARRSGSLAPRGRPRSWDPRWP